MSLPHLPQNNDLKDVDPVIFGLINDERARQVGGLELIASENFTSAAVQKALGSCLTNKYSEGLPGKRYYGGNSVIDQVESLCQRRALTAFHLDEKKWGVNVQPYSGSVANLAALMATLEPGETLLGLSLAAGGHLTHGHQSPKKKISASAIFYNAVQYGVDPQGVIDYDQMDKLADEHKPKLIICGASAYPRDWDYARFRAAADRVGAKLMADIAHIAGLVAAQEHNDPFKYCDVVTTTSHKSLRGPRSGMVFYRKGLLRDAEDNDIADSTPYDLEARVNFAVFPSLQGGPHEHQIAAVAVALFEVDTPEFKLYAKQVIANTKALATALVGLGHSIITGTSENHLLLWNCKAIGSTGSKVEKACDLAHITVNKNMIVGDTSAFSPGGVRLGTPALTSRGLKEEHMIVIAGFLDRAAKVATLIGETCPKLATFTPAAEKNEDLIALGKEVVEFSSQFGLPGYAL